jgi:hypothetical protein
MKQNQFTVDLGDLKLSDAQRQTINGAIQSAVANELGKLNFKGGLALFPVNKFPKGPILNGMYVRQNLDVVKLTGLGK